MSQSPRLALPYLAERQAAKHVTMNEALRRLDALVQLSVASRDTAAPPAEPDEGEAYIVPDGAETAWQTTVGDLCAWQDGAWTPISPATGWRAWIADESRLVVYDGAGWTSDGLAPDSQSRLGINTDADPANRLAVKSDSVLFSHDDVTPGSGDVRLSVNKSGDVQNASLLFQSGFTGHAEIGLAGTNDLSFKVSSDGSAFTEALLIDAASGAVTFPASAISERSRTVLTPGSGTYTPPAGVRAIEVTAIGAGGGGAGAETTSSGVFVGAGGGGAGGIVRKVISGAALETSYDYEVGLGGAGGAADPGDPVGSRDGEDGGASSFEGAVLSLIASGGQGAPEDTASSAATEFVGGPGGAASGGDLNLTGQRGGGGVTKASEFYQIGAGTGASSLFGQGGTFKNGNGNTGLGFGSGGSGCGMIPGFVINRSGGAGAPGAILIEEFF